MRMEVQRRTKHSTVILRCLCAIEQMKRIHRMWTGPTAPKRGISFLQIVLLMISILTKTKNFPPISADIGMCNKLCVDFCAAICVCAFNWVGLPKDQINSILIRLNWIYVERSRIVTAMKNSNFQITSCRLFTSSICITARVYSSRKKSFLFWFLIFW